ncbi:MAG TPA: hypothetical protein VNV86_15860 [Candidatus Acidoferrum sp.]|jgi:hypothetical protein|nr:hypothetical protein [Candidatus Acidoferrum sp.]
MRSDIAKVVFEKAKRTRTWVSKTPRPAAVELDNDEQVDDRPDHIRRRSQIGRNSNKSPLEHFLACRVGRPWDAVWSEICAATRNSLGRKIRHLVDCAVDRDCWIEGRTVMTRCCSGLPIKVRGFYVHPRSGLLRRAPEDR